MTTAEALERPGRSRFPTYSLTQELPLTVAEPDRPHPATGLNDPVAEALRTQETFGRAQVAWLMSLSMGWGYDLGYEDGQRDELALASVAAAYSSTKTFSAEVTERGIKQRNQRREADAAARLPRPGDYRGGPVPAWGDNEYRRAA